MASDIGCEDATCFMRGRSRLALRAIPVLRFGREVRNVPAGLIFTVCVVLLCSFTLFSYLYFLNMSAEGLNYELDFVVGQSHPF